MDNDHLVSRGGTEDLCSASIALVTITSAIVVARLCTRVLVLSSAGVDDILILIALLATTGMTVSMCKENRLHMDQDTTNTAGLWQALWASIWTYNIAITFTKASILVSYMRIFVGRWTQLTCKWLLIFVCINGAWEIGSSFFACLPISRAWTSPNLYGDHQCLNRWLIWFINAAVDMITTLITTLIPMPSVRSLNMPRSQKMGLILVFALGGLVCFISIIRIVFLVDIMNKSNRSHVAIWSDIEVNAGVMCASLPTLRALVPWLRSHTPRSRNHESQVLRDVSGSSSRRRFSLERSIVLPDYPTQATWVEGGKWKDRTKRWDQRWRPSSQDDSELNLSRYLSKTEESEEPGRGITITTVLEQEVKDITAPRNPHAVPSRCI